MASLNLTRALARAEEGDDVAGQREALRNLVEHYRSEKRAAVAVRFARRWALLSDTAPGIASDVVPRLALASCLAEAKENGEALELCARIIREVKERLDECIFDADLLAIEAEAHAIAADLLSGEPALASSGVRSPLRTAEMERREGVKMARLSGNAALCARLSAKWPEVEPSAVARSPATGRAGGPRKRAREASLSSSPRFPAHVPATVALLSQGREAAPPRRALQPLSPSPNHPTGGQGDPGGPADANASIGEAWGSLQDVAPLDLPSLPLAALVSNDLAWRVPSPPTAAKESATAQKAVRPTDSPSNGSDRIDEDLVCTVCHELMFKPVSISCGHSFCKACVSRWFRVKRTCPHCRTEHDKFVSDGINTVLWNLIQRRHPEVVARAWQSREKELQVEERDATHEQHRAELLARMARRRQEVPQTDYLARARRELARPPGAVHCCHCGLVCIPRVMRSAGRVRRRPLAPMPRFPSAR